MLTYILWTLAVIWIAGFYTAYHTLARLAKAKWARWAITLIWPPVLLLYALIFLFVTYRGEDNG